MSQRSRRIQQQERRRALARNIAMVVAAALLGVAAVAFAARLGSNDGGSAGGGGGDGPSVRVSLIEFAFAPDPIVVRAEDARLEIVNDGAVAHDLVVPELGKGTPDLPPGEGMVLDLTSQPAGTYRVVCDLPGHTEAGMVTELTIE